MSIFVVVRHQNAYVHAKHPIWEKQTKLPKIYLPSVCLFVCFSTSYVPNAKIHAKRPFWRNRTALPKMCILTVVEFLRYQNAKMHAKQPQWSNGTTLPETCHLGYFFSIGTKTLKKKKKHSKGIFLVILFAFLK